MAVNPNPVRVFVGSDERGGRGEIALTQAIKRFSGLESQVVYMRPGGEGGHWEHADWNMGRSHYRPYSGEGWATNFTCFRWTIPEVAGFQGRAIYVDADQTIHADCRDLQEVNLDGKCCAIRKGVIVFDCGHPFWKSRDWPRLEQMKKSGEGIGAYAQRVNRFGGGSSLFPEHWDNLDGKQMNPYKAKLNHYTAMQWQPYFPFPDRFRYPECHPNPLCSSIFWESYRDALSELAGEQVAKFKKWRNTRAQCWDLERRLGLNMFGREVGYQYYFTEPQALARESAKLNPWLAVRM